jgi:1,4-alpha-glucan branching enzyme
MKKYLLFIFLFSSISFLKSQVSSIPVFFSDSEEITIRFDATQGNKALENYNGDVYVHTGLITSNSTNGTDWKYATTWGDNQTKYKATRVSQNIYELKITQSVKTFYSVSGLETILKIAVLFRNAQGDKVARTAEGGDMFLDLSDDNLALLVESPLLTTTFQDTIKTIELKATAKKHDSLQIFVNNKKLTSTENTFITYDYTPQQGVNIVEFKAFNQTDSIIKKYTVASEIQTQQEELPQNLKEGINIMSDNSVVFVLHAPFNDNVFLLGDFNDWRLEEKFQMKKASDQRFWIQLTGLDVNREYLFQYLVDGKLRIADAYTEKIVSQDDQYIDSQTYPSLIEYPSSKTSGNISTFKIMKSNYTWQVNNFKAPNKENLIIYEMLIRDFTEGPNGKEGNYKGAIEKLDYIKELGVNAIELMPTNEFEGNNSWGYNPSFYFAVDKAYGTANDLKSFIDEAHKRGIAVIGDLVLNHAFGQNPFVQLVLDKYANDEIYTKANNPWFNTKSPNQTYKWGADFNHELPETQKFVDRVVKYWLDEFKFDGFRFDFTKGFTNMSGDGSAYDESRITILKRLYNKMHEANANAYVIIEHLAGNEEEKKLSEHGFLMWANSNHEYNEASMGYTANLSRVPYVDRGYQKKSLINYAESHDEERLMYKNLEYGYSSANYNVKDKKVALQRQELIHAFLIPIPGPKMIWQFGELGYEFSIDENGRVGKKPIHWEYTNEYRRAKLYKTISKLNKLKTGNTIFNNSEFKYRLDGNKVKYLDFKSNDSNVVVIGNFGTEVQDYEYDFEFNGKYVDQLTGEEVEVKNNGYSFSLNPGEFKFLSNKMLNNYDYAPTDVVTDVTEINKTDKIFKLINKTQYRLLLTPLMDEISSIEIYDILGNRVYLNNKFIAEETINFNSNGVYFIKASKSGSSQIEKVLIY